MATNKPTKEPTKQQPKHTGFLNDDGELKVRTMDVLEVMYTEIKNISTKLKPINAKEQLK